MVYIVNDCWKIVSCWCRNNNLSCSCFDMSRCFFFRCVESCTLKYYVYSKFSPWKVFSISFSVDCDFFSINCDRVFTSFYFIS